MAGEDRLGGLVLLQAGVFLAAFADAHPQALAGALTLERKAAGRRRRAEGGKGQCPGGAGLGGIALDKQNGGDVVVLNGDAGRVVQLGLQRQGLAVQRQGAVQITLFAEQPGQAAQLVRVVGIRETGRGLRLIGGGCGRPSARICGLDGPGLALAILVTAGGLKFHDPVGDRHQGDDKEKTN